MARWFRWREFTASHGFVAAIFYIIESCVSSKAETKKGSQP